MYWNGHCQHFNFISGLYFPVLQITATAKSVPEDFFQKAAMPTTGDGQKCEEMNNHPEQYLTTA